MDRTAVKVMRLGEQDEALCLSLSPTDRIRVLEELNRQGRILAGYSGPVKVDRMYVCAGTQHAGAVGTAA